MIECQQINAAWAFAKGQFNRPATGMEIVDSMSPVQRAEVWCVLNKVRMSETDKTHRMVDFRSPRKGETFLSMQGAVILAIYDNNVPFPIVEKRNQQ